MSDLPILFSAPMVRAILREIEAPGTGKTQTRRDHPPEPNFIPDGCCQADLGGRACWWDFWAHGRAERQRFKLPYAVGDRLYVREHWRSYVSWDEYAPCEITPATRIFYDADGFEAREGLGAGRFRQGMHMPRWASRLTLIVTDVRVERLRAISEADAVAEGIERNPSQPSTFRHYGVLDGFAWLGDPVHSYSTLWNSINGPNAWAANPWVVAYTFRPILGNIDQIEVQA